MLWIEPSGACNLKCPGCPTGTGTGSGVMHYKDFVKVIDQVPFVKLLNLWHRGEPLMAPGFADIVSEATRRGIRSQTHTNGTLLARKDTAERIVESGLTRIGIGIDGSDEETYHSFRSGGKLEQVEAGVRALVEARKKLKSRKPRIIAECLVSNQNQAQFSAVEKMAISWGCDAVKFKTYYIDDLTNTENALKKLPNDRRLWRYIINDNCLEMKRTRLKCRRLAFSAVIAWNGDVLPCCFDSDARYVLGNAFREPWREIWKGEKIKDFNRKVNKNNRNDTAMCRNCTEGLSRLYIPNRQVTR
ncbi:MAG: radical SAM protein [Calditrichaeota bacterium]|nr:radical SAM protein [Calditrichota bacterium]MBT7789307.1 radical SAM protein [Calditrichota bacterium]